jgi:peptide/nickel transport system substrate-binding protein
VGTGPFKLENWNKGSSVSLSKWDGYRDAANVKLRRATFRFVNDPAAQVAALLAGDIDGMPRFGALQALEQFKRDKRFTVEIGSTSGKGILAINNRKKPLDDVRVRRAIMHAIDRKAFIDGVQEGLGKPIGSHFAPTDLGYVDHTGMYPYDPEKAKVLLRDAGVTTPLNLTLTLPPPQYARKGGEVVAAMLAKAGINAKIENVEWAQWLAGPFKGNFDLTIINHVEPLDFATAYADPNYYFGYDSAKFRGLVATLGAVSDLKERARLWRDIQRTLAEDAVNAFIWNPAQVAVFRKGLRGLWNSSPIFANDLSAVRWQAAG